MTYNVNIFGLYNWQSKEIKPNILRLIFDENPDILCLQEAFWSGDKNYFVTVDSILLKLRTKNVHKFAIATAVGKQNFGLVIISKYPIINSYSEKFDSCSNGFCFVDIVKDEDTIRIFNLHLLSMHFDENDYTALSKITDKDHRVTDLKNASGLLKKYMTSCITRAKQADIVRKMLDDTTYPIILCGDLNDIPLSYSYNKIRSNLTDAHKKRGRINDHTWIFNNYKLRIDNIFYSDNFKCKNYYILNEPLSDHYAVVSELR
jgi:endonuclease/exonuclease/phosphatase family metal-dependent hydrolase